MRSFGTCVCMSILPIFYSVYVVGIVGRTLKLILQLAYSGFYYWMSFIGKLDGKKQKFQIKRNLILFVISRMINEIKCMYIFISIQCYWYKNVLFFDTILIVLDLFITISASELGSQYLSMLQKQFVTTTLDKGYERIRVTIFEN